MINRDDLIVEQALRDVVRKAIKKITKENKKRQLNEEKELRSVIRKAILLEKTPVGKTDESPHEKTGINMLRRTLKKVVPQIRDDYMTLTTDPDQRKSYIAHLINGIDNLLAPIEANAQAPESADNVDLEEEIEVDVGDETEDFVDFEGSDSVLPSDEEEEEEVAVDDDTDVVTKGMADDNDETGRNLAIATFKQVQNTIVDDFENLANNEDRELYHDYLKTNLLLWRDKFEDALSTNLPEPTTPEYEKASADSKGKDDLLEIDI